MSDIETCLSNIGANRMLGLLSGFSGPRPKQPTLWWRAYARFTDFILFCNFVTISVNFATPGVSLPDRCIGGFPLFALSLAIFRQLYLLVRRGRLAKLVLSFNETMASTDEEEGGSRIQRWFPLVLLMMSVMTMAPWCVAPAFTEVGLGADRKLSVPAWFPISMELDLAFYTVILIQTLGATYTPMKNIAFDDLFLSLGFAQLLRIRRLGRDYSRLFSVYKLDEDGSLSFVDYDGHPVTPLESHRLLKREFGLWIERHKQCIREMKELQTIYSPAFLMMFAFQILQLCTNAFVVAAVPMALIHLVFCTLYVLGQALALLCTCRLGDLLTADSESINEGIVDSGCLIACHTKLKSSIFITLIRCQQQYKMSALGVFPLNTDTFRAIILSSYSYFMMLIKMRKTIE